MNALKHGLTAEMLILPNEDPEAYEARLQEWLDAFQPANPAERAMIDVAVQMPGAGAREVEERITKPMEKLLWEIPGVEYIYSTSSPGMSLAIVASDKSVVATGNHPRL